MAMEPLFARPNCLLSLPSLQERQPDHDHPHLLVKVVATVHHYALTRYEIAVR